MSLPVKSQLFQRITSPFIAILLCSLTIAGEPSADSFEKVKQNYRDYLLGSVPSAAAITNMIKQQQPDGTWPGIDYNDQGRGSWRVANHVYKLENMAKAFCAPKSKLYHDPSLKQAILRGLDNWIEKRYVCPNWWFNEIGCPRPLANTVFLMKEELSETQLAGSLDYIKQAKFGMTGQNSVWTAGITFTRALIEENQELARKAREIILKELKITTAEGLQPDNSFHQHGPQLQFGNYGMGFANDMVRWGMLWQGTEFALSEHQIELLRGYMLDGLHLTVYKGHMDISSCGRQLFSNPLRGKANGVIGLSNQIQQLDPSHAEQYAKVNQLPPKRSMHFWRSDYFIQHTDHYMTSVKMSSNRTQGTETCNSENMQGYFLGDGAHYVYVAGDEYDDIFPVWDWRHLPGVTCHQNPTQSLKPKRGRTNKSDFVGGLGSQIIVSDGKKSFQPGVAALDYNRDGLTAKKSWFFFEDCITCLGAGIKSDEPYPVHTTINQCHLDGPVYVWIDGVRTEHPAGKLAVYKNVDAIWHDHILYRFPHPTEVNVSTRVQTGSWKLVLGSKPDKPISDPIFSAWIDHGIRPDNASYRYVVAPNREPELPQSPFDTSSVAIVFNDTNVQEVEGSVEPFAAVVYKPSKLKYSWGPDISVDQPCVLTANELQMSVADPTQKLQQIIISHGEKKETVLLPQNGKAGSRAKVTSWDKTQ